MNWRTPSVLCGYSPKFKFPVVPEVLKSGKSDAELARVDATVALKVE